MYPLLPTFCRFANLLFVNHRASEDNYCTFYVKLIRFQAYQQCCGGLSQSVPFPKLSKMCEKTVTTE